MVLGAVDDPGFFRQIGHSFLRERSPDGIAGQVFPAFLSIADFAKAQELSDSIKVSDLHRALEGTRIQHHMGASSIKMYDKFGIILRIETTSNDVSEFKHYREVQ